jgi:hypothetical protein
MFQNQSSEQLFLVQKPPRRLTTTKKMFHSAHFRPTWPREFLKTTTKPTTPTPAPDHTSPALHLAVAHHHHTSLSHLAVAPPQHHNHPLTTHCRERPQHCSSTQTNHIPPPQPTILHKMYDSDLPARHPPRDLSSHRCCRLHTSVIR